MQKDLFIMERAIALNIYQPRQARYRGLDVVPGKSRYVILLIVKRNQNIPIWKIFFVLLQASDKEKNLDYPLGIKPQTFGFRAPMLYH